MKKSMELIIFVPVIICVCALQIGLYGLIKQGSLAASLLLIGNLLIPIVVIIAACCFHDAKQFYRSALWGLVTKSIFLLCFGGIQVVDIIVYNGKLQGFRLIPPIDDMITFVFALIIFLVSGMILIQAWFMSALPMVSVYHLYQKGHISKLKRVLFTICCVIPGVSFLMSIWIFVIARKHRADEGEQFENEILTEEVA